MKTKTLLIILGAVFISLVAVILILNQFGLLTIFFGVNKMNCDDAGTNIVSCSAAGTGLVTGPDEAKFYVNNPSKLEDRASIACKKFKYLTGESCPSKPPKMASSTWRSVIDAFLNEKLGKQLIIVKGDYSMERGTPVLGTFEAFGIGRFMARDFMVKNPVLEGVREGYGWIEKPSITIYFKEGGYTEEDIENMCAKGTYKCEDDILMKCVDYKWKTWETCDYKCQDGLCIEDPCKGVTCPDKCENSIRKYEGYHKAIDDSKCECVYKEITCEYGCSNGLCKEDPCKGIECNDKCENSIWYHDGRCENGKCVYDSKDTCQYGCQGEPSPMLAIIVGEGMCRDDPCLGITCPDYCLNDDKNTLATEGRCINGKCQYPKSGEKPYSEECGYVPIWKRTWVWIGGASLIIVLVFSFIYWRRKKKVGLKHNYH